MIEFLIEKYDLKSENSIVVGDTIGDFACAEKNVLDAVIVTYGYGNIHEPDDCNAKYVVNSVSELEHILLNS